MCAPASCVAALAATVIGLTLVAYRGWPVLAIGVASLLAALAYMGGPRPIAYTPFGELTVFVFFGLVAVNGTDWVLTGSVGTVSLLASVAIGSLAAAALAVNNHRDIAHDRLVGRRTFAASFGPQASIGLFGLLLIAPFALLPWMALVADGPALLLPLLLLPGGPAVAARLHRIAHPARPSTRCCSAPSGWSSGSRHCSPPARCLAACMVDALARPAQWRAAAPARWPYQRSDLACSTVYSSSGPRCVPAVSSMARDCR